MKKAITAFMVFLCFSGAQMISAQQKNTLRYEIMLSSNMLEPSLKNDHFLNILDISPGKYITISSDRKIYMLGWGGINQFGQATDSTISSFAFASDGLLMAIVNDRLCYMNDKGILVTLVKLPDANMGISEGKDVMYLFNQKKEDEKYRLYAFAKGGRYKQLLVSPLPLTAVVEMDDSLYIAIGSGIFSYSPEDSKLNLVAGFQKDNEIKSVTVDPINSILYIATRDAIYALQNESLVLVTSDFGGGIIKYFDKGLIIFNPETSDIIRIVNIAGSIVF
jgi:hypothetical protein